MGSGLFVVSTLGCALFMGSVGMRLAFVDEKATERHTQSFDDESVLASPGRTLLGLASMEHPYGWADWTWLTIVQELSAAQHPTPATWDKVQRFANIATDLDERYFVVYQASAVQLSVYGKRVDASDQLLEKGRRALPSAWEFPFMLGYNAYFLRGDPVLAADLFLAASRLPGSPRYLPALAGRARFQSGDESGAVALLEDLLKHEGEGPRREDIQIRLRLLKSEPILRAYDEACLRFRQDTGALPRSSSELLERGYVRFEPKDLFDKVITLDGNCRARTQTVLVREDEAARDRIGSQAKGN